MCVLIVLVVLARIKIRKTVEEVFRCQPISVCSVRSVCSAAAVLCEFGVTHISRGSFSQMPFFQITQHDFFVISNVVSTSAAVVQDRRHLLSLSWKRS